MLNFLRGKDSIKDEEVLHALRHDVWKTAEMILGDINRARADGIRKEVRGSIRRALAKIRIGYILDLHDHLIETKQFFELTPEERARMGAENIPAPDDTIRNSAHVTRLRSGSGREEESKAREGTLELVTALSS